MQDPRLLAIQDYSYELPEERIARFPLAARDESKLLIWRQQHISEDVYGAIARHLTPGSLLIFNNTRVIEARLFFQKPSGGVIEVFTLEPDEQYGDIQSAMQQKGRVLWKCLIGGASKWKHGQLLEKKITDPEEVLLQARIAGRLADSFLIEFTWAPAELAFAEILHRFGIIPIPPYLHRATEAADEERYQTIFAQSKGSVAAPTAGLHFTDAIFKSFDAANIHYDFVTLHVGAGTFMPVKSATMEDHAMHAEYLDVEASLISRIAKWPSGIFAVGTTSLRTLESLYWMGVKCSLDRNITPGKLEIQQWEVYGTLADSSLSREAALQALLSWMTENGLDRLVIKTRILIAPPYKTRMISGLVTNFHQPHSTLLLLVAAITGKHWKEIYQYAMEHDFRFLSYGDGCLLFTD